MIFLLSRGRTLTSVNFLSARRLKPDQRSEPTGLPVTTVVVEAYRVAHGTQTTTMNGLYPQRLQAQSRQLIDIRQIVPRPGRWLEAVRSGDAAEDLLDLRSDLEGVGTDRRPQPDQQFLRGHLHGSHGIFQNAGGQPPPAGMGCCHPGAGAVAEQDRQAIGS